MNLNKLSLIFLLVGLVFGGVEYDDLEPDTTNKWSLGTATFQWKDAFGDGTLDWDSITDGTTTITGGNYTGVGNLTGTDVDISAGTGSFTGSGTSTFGEIIDSGLTASRLVATDGSKQLISSDLTGWVAGGLAIDVTDDGDGTITLDFDATEIDAETWSDGANASNLWTFDVSGTDPCILFSDGTITLTGNTLVRVAEATTNVFFNVDRVNGKVLTLQVGGTQSNILYDNTGALAIRSADPCNLRLGSAAGASNVAIFSAAGNTNLTGDGDIDGALNVDGAGVIGDGLTVNDDNAGGVGLILKGLGAGAPTSRGGVIRFLEDSTNIAGYLFANTDGRLVGDTTAQGSGADTGNFWIDFDDGSASFGGHTMTISSAGAIAGTALDIGDGTNKALISTTGDLVFVGTAGMAYGEISVKDNAVATTLNSGAEVQLTVFDTDGPSNNTAPDQANNEITITTAGHYLVTISVHVNNNAVQTHTIDVSLNKNNGARVELINVHGHRTLTGGSGDVGSLSLSGIVDLAVGDELQLWATTDIAADRSVTFEDITLTIIQVGGT